MVSVHFGHCHLPHICLPKLQAVFMIDTVSTRSFISAHLDGKYYSLYKKHEPFEMAVIPIALVGNNLGKRHQYLNNLVNDAFERQIAFETIQDLPEVTPIDRLFKIDLASKYRKSDYILKSLKDEDMLYVTRALKCLWLLHDSKYSELLTPHYLEQFLYPEMSMVAARKMRQWIAINIKDKVKSQMFYEYYKEKDFTYAIKFFPKCPAEYVGAKLFSIPLTSITPHFMKLVCENIPVAAQIFLTIIKTENLNFSKEYNVKKHKSIASHLNFLLKSDPDQFFYFIENFYDPSLKRFNKTSTKYIIKNHKARFEAKPELYVARFLDLKTLSKYLSNSNIKKLVIKLMQAEFIPDLHCDYKFAEPLLKRMDKNEKTKFCKIIFENKSFGAKITSPPYFIPWIHQDELYDPPKNYDHNLEIVRPRMMCASGFCPGPNRLASLFDQYRFKGFEKTFSELKKAKPKESGLENRQKMFLVLISKTGGKAAHIRSLIKFLFSHHSNEPASLRATLIRSLVKRAAVWRVTSDVWDMLLKFGHDLGLDGKDAVAPCVEGLHGVFLHDIVQLGQLNQPVLNTFLREFNPLSVYSLTKEEKDKVFNYILGVLMDKAKTDVDEAPNRFSQVLDLLNAYLLKLEKHTEIILTIKGAISKDYNAFRPLLERIFKMKVARRTFFSENFEIIKTDSSYVNALRHDTMVLRDEKRINTILDENGAKHLKIFLRKLIIYFGEQNGIASLYLRTLKKRLAADNTKIGMARTLACLTSGEEAKNLCDLFSEAKTTHNKLFASALWSNIHLTRPRLPFAIDKIKTKSYLAVGNYIHICGPVSLEQLMPTILLHPRLARQCLALRAPFTTGFISKMLPSAAKNRCLRALQTALRILRKHNLVYTKEDWKTVKNIIENIDLKKKQRDVYLNLVKINNIPEEYRIHYCLLMYRALTRAKLGSDTGPPYLMTNSILPCIYDNLEEADTFSLHEIIINFLSEHFSTKNILSRVSEYKTYVENFIKIIVGFLLCNSNEKHNAIENIGKTLLNQLKDCWHNSNIDMKRLLTALNQPLTNLKINNFEAVYFMRLLMEFYDEAVPIVVYFKLHVEGRLSIFMQQALYKSVGREPNLFRNTRVIHKSEKCLEILGAAYVEILLQDVEDMTKKYFDSIVPMYAKAVHNFIENSSFNFASKKIFILSIVKNLLKDEKRPMSIFLGILLCSDIALDKDEKKSVMDLISSIDDNRVQLIQTHVFKPMSISPTFFSMATNTNPLVRDRQFH